jgi:hypothetical protein
VGFDKLLCNAKADGVNGVAIALKREILVGSESVAGRGATAGTVAGFQQHFFGTLLNYAAS